MMIAAVLISVNVLAQGFWRTLGNVLETTNEVLNGASSGSGYSATSGMPVPQDYDDKVVGTDGSVFYYKQNANGSMTSWMVKACFGCNGTGKCRGCNGSGQMYYSSLGYVRCNVCGASGVCTACYGKRYTVITSVTDADGNGYSYDQNGKVQYGSRNSSSSSGSGGVCTSCRGKKYESQSFEYAAASRAGVRQPYHHYGGSGCPYCKKSTEHYHYPCSHCLGTGKE